MSKYETLLCSDCKDKKGNITKKYCLSNPLNAEYEEEPDWEHYGGWHISQAQNCREFCKENNISNINGINTSNEL